MAAASILTPNIVVHLQALISMQPQAGSFDRGTSVNLFWLLKNHRTNASIINSLGMLLVGLDILFIGQMNFLIFFVCMSILRVIYGLFFYKATSVTTAEILSKMAPISATDNLVGYGCVFLGALTTLGTAYLQHGFYGLYSPKEGFLTILGLLLFIVSIRGLIISALARKN